MSTYSARYKIRKMEAAGESSPEKIEFLEQFLEQTGDKGSLEPGYRGPVKFYFHTQFSQEFKE